jgi:hypothetical protein
MTDEWGPWIEHDGSGCPCVGMWVHRIYGRPGLDTVDGKTKSEKIGLVMNAQSGCWRWSNGFSPVIRYRIRKPRALQQMIDRAAKLDAPQGVNA